MQFCITEILRNSSLLVISGNMNLPWEYPLARASGWHSCNGCRHGVDHDPLRSVRIYLLDPPSMMAPSWFCSGTPGSPLRFLLLLSIRSSKYPVVLCSVDLFLTDSQKIQIRSVDHQNFHLFLSFFLCISFCFRNCSCNSLPPVHRNACYPHQYNVRTFRIDFCPGSPAVPGSLSEDPHTAAGAL